MNESNRSIFSGMQILFKQQWIKDQALVIEDGSIKALILAEMIPHHLPARRYEFPSDYYLVPGFIDLHIHGADHHDVMDGTKEAITSISQALAREGVTGYLATTMTAHHKHLTAVLTTLSLAMSEQEGAAILGIHLEGPFIAKTGAHREEDIQLPDWKMVNEWQKKTNQAIKLVTLAPELPGALQFIHALRDMDIIPSIGHTNATYEETQAAILAGATQATHLFNAMCGLHQREPGALGALLLANEISAELIVDGFHLHPAVVELAFRMKGRDRLLLITDAMRAKCLGDGQYELGGQRVTVTAGKVTLQNGTLAGSTLRMPQAIKNMMQFAHCSLIDALKMASYNPARALGLEIKKGTIDIRKDADLVVLSPQFDVMMTMRAGKKIYSS